MIHYAGDLARAFLAAFSHFVRDAWDVSIRTSLLPYFKTPKLDMTWPKRLFFSGWTGQEVLHNIEGLSRLNRLTTRHTLCIHSAVSY